MSGKVSVVVGGQFGSEAKGAVAGFLASLEQNSSSVVCVRVGGPNAGHTVYGRCPEGCTQVHTQQAGDDTFEGSHPWRLRQVPVAAVTNPTAWLLIAAGSEIDFTVLRDEIHGLNSAGYDVTNRLWLDESATVLTSRHIEAEQVDGLNGRIGSTAKGIGAARSERIWRRAETVKRFAGMLPASMARSTSFLNYELERGAHVVIEGTQGYGLGLHTEYYPQVTSGDCRAIDFLAQSGLSPWSSAIEKLDVWVVARTYPIRVAGNSGPLSDETSWDTLGLEPEQTTVTQKTRRVGEWDPNLVLQAVIANGGGEGNSTVKLALMMADYKIPEIKGVRSVHDLEQPAIDQLAKLVADVEGSVPAAVGLVGTGPTTIIDFRGVWL